MYSQITFYSQCHTKRTPGWVDASHAFFWHDNDKYHKACIVSQAEPAEEKAPEEQKSPRKNTISMFDDEDKDEDDGDLFASSSKPKAKQPEQVSLCRAQCHGL